MHGDCRRWLDEAKSLIPSVMIDVTTTRGAVGNLSVVLDGEVQADATEGHAIEIAPGVHHLEVSAPGYETATVTFTAHEREQHRRLNVELVPIPSAPKSAEESSPWVSVPVLISGGVALVGVGAFAYFGATARSRDRALDECTPECSRSVTNGIKRDYLIANVSAGVGAAAAVTALVLWLVEPDSRADETEPALSFDWSPNHAGASYQTHF
jgi:hypothetical protein